MVKKRFVPIALVLAASFMFSAQPLSAAVEHEWQEVKVENSEEDSKYEYNNYYNKNDEKSYEKQPRTGEGSDYIGIKPIDYEITAVERPNTVSRLEEVNNIKINGAIPQIVGINARGASNINARIQASFLALVNGGHRNIEASFDVHNWGGITSLVVRYQTAGDRHVVHTFVFDNVTKSEVTLRNLLGRDFMSYVNNRVTTGLREGRERGESGYVYPNNITNFRTIRANQDFYIKDGNIHIVFEQARVAHTRYGVVEFVVPINNLSYVLTQNQFVKEDGKIFVPATVARRFGMDVDITHGGIMRIRSGERAVNINVHNDYKNPSEVMYINGYDVALSSEFLQRELGISVERVEGSREVTVTYRFNR